MKPVFLTAQNWPRVASSDLDRLRIRIIYTLLDGGLFSSKRG